MVQTMLQNNPQAQQALQQLASMTPEQLARVTQLSQMFAGGNMPAFPGGGAPSTFPGGGAPSTGASSAAPPANDPNQTEEDMIAEAIRRSLEDQNNNNNGGGGT